ncbi:MAG: NAD(P)H-dependent oxidoreductase [Proteobacteria bacterium]|jgi:NAD(P)H-dependent FMN reductase|nr:NAD(P)H-dependent oxidoreductase [Pseudomonadota bacterium]
MKFTIVSGSTRQSSQSIKVSKYIEHILGKKLHEECYLLNLATANLKFWDESFWQEDPNKFDANWTKARNEINNSDALIIVAPEWNGMIPPALKNFFHLAVKGEISNKPALIVSVSASVNGVYPITELRMNSYKNTVLCYIPQHVIVRNVGTQLNDLVSPENEEDKIIRERIESSLKVLIEYAKAFKTIRSSDAVKNFPFPYGM